ncbi:hypothetical protein [Methylibium petroleiphilum]|uniref:hypothetical protein n=1 Tax=Methylibium petroleiphilum TaxID=105560 RepID=UPI00003CD18F|nr:hypothetical protein [Methylibium petroleiphilum]
MFARLFGHDADQVLITLDQNDEGRPTLFFHAQPRGLGICRLGLSFTDCDVGWGLARKGLAEMTEERARAAVRGIYESPLVLAVQEP